MWVAQDQADGLLHMELAAKCSPADHQFSARQRIRPGRVRAKLQSALESKFAEGFSSTADPRGTASFLWSLRTSSCVRSSARKTRSQPSKTGTKTRPAWFERLLQYCNKFFMDAMEFGKRETSYCRMCSSSAKEKIGTVYSEYTEREREYCSSFYSLV